MERNLNQQLGSIQRLALVVGGLGVIACIVLVLMMPEVFYQSYLLAFLFWLGVPLGSAGMLMIYRLTGGHWGTAMGRPFEAAVSTLPLMAVLFLPILVGMTTLYEWANEAVVAADPVLQHKAAYLNVPFFVIRTVIYFAVWIIGGWLLITWGERYRQTCDPALGLRLSRIAAPGLILYAATMTFAAVDWVMSLEPHWFSTIYGLVLIIGQVLSALCIAIMVLTWATRRRPTEVTLPLDTLHDMAKLMFMAVCLTAYIAFSQFLIIWYANLPEEIIWYLPRTHTGWNIVAVTLIVFYFVLPFALLLPRRSNRKPRFVFGVALLLLLTHLLELMWLVAPAFNREVVWPAAVDVAVWLALGGVWAFVFLGRLRKLPLLTPQAMARLDHRIPVTTETHGSVDRDPHDHHSPLAMEGKP